MIVPDTTRAQMAVQTPQKPGTKSWAETVLPRTNPSEPNASSDARNPSTRSSRGFKRGIVFLKTAPTSERTIPYRGRSEAGLIVRQGCPRAEEYYSCANGFKGCCAFNPCGPDGGCSRRASKTASTKPTRSQHRVLSSKSSRSVAITSPARTRTVAKSSAYTSLEPSVTSSEAHKHSIQSTASSTKTRPLQTSGVTVTPAPSCPSGNGTLYNDSLQVSYIILCGYDNSFAVDSIVPVNAGGYNECFFACSKLASCAGFTFIGDDRGKCYFKSQMPMNKFEDADASYVSCAKANLTIAGELPSRNSSSSSSQSTTRPKSVGITVGAIVGGVGLLGLLIFLAAFFARRHRRKLEKRHSRGIIIGAPQAINPGDTTIYQHHRRAGSTGNDVFTMYGGSYHPPTPTRSHTRQRSIYHDDRNWV